MRAWKQRCENCGGKRFEVYETDREKDNGDYEMKFICCECGYDYDRNELMEEPEPETMP